jgi:erythromycin esterase
VAIRCAVTARDTDAAMADTVEWILEREDRIVIAAASGHLQRWPYSAPPIIVDPLTTAGQHTISPWHTFIETPPPE